MSDWLTVEQASAHIGKSLSTIRRAIPKAPAGTVRRVNGKVLLKREYLEQIYKAVERTETAADTLNDLRQYIASLEQDNAAKTAIIAQLTEANFQLSKVNAALLLAHNPKQDAPADLAGTRVDWLLIAVWVTVIIAGAVIVWLVIG